MKKVLIACFALAVAPNLIASAADVSRLTSKLAEAIEAIFPESSSAEVPRDDRAIVMHARLIRTSGGLAEAAWITARREARAGRKEDALKWIGDAEKALRYIRTEIPKLLKSVSSSRHRERDDIRALAEQTLNASAQFSDELRRFEKSVKDEPNKSPEPTPLAVTPPADAGVAPSSAVAHL